MSLQGDVRIDQDGVVPSALALTNSNAFAVAIVDPTGTQIPGFDASRPANSSITSIPYATGAVQVVAANPTRRGLVLYNATNKPVNIALATGASATGFSFVLPTAGSYESDLNGYTGIVTAFWGNAPSTGATLHATEITT